MPLTQDDVITVFKLVGEQEYISGFTRAAAGPDLLERRLGEFRREQVAAGIAVGVGVGALGFFGRAAFAAADEQVKFNRAVSNFKGQLPRGELDAFTKEITGLTGIDDDRVAQVIGILGTFQIKPQDAKNLTLPIFNAAEALKALGITAETTANQVGKAIQTGNAGPLRRAGIVIDLDQFKAAATEGERTRLVIAALQAQGGNAAAEFRDSLPGALQAFTSELHNAQEEIGKVEVSPLRGIVEGGVAIVHAFNEAPDAVKTLATAIGVGLATQVTILGARTFVTLGNTIRLGEAHLKAAAEARNQATAEDQLANSLTRVATSSGRIGPAPLPSRLPGAGPAVIPVAPSPASAPSPVPITSQPAAAGLFGTAAAALGLAGARNLPPTGPSPATAAAAASARAQALAPPGTAVNPTGIGAGSRAQLQAAFAPAPVPVQTAPAPVAPLGGLNRAAVPGALFAGAAALSLVPETGNKPLDTGKDVLQGALFGALLGAQIGSLAGPEGTLIGGGVGAVAGGVGAFFTDQQKEKQVKAEGGTDAQGRQIALLEKQNKHLEETNNLLRGIVKGDVPFATSEISGRAQVTALQGMLESL